MQRSGLRFEKEYAYPMYPDREMEVVKYALNREGYQPEKHAQKAEPGFMSERPLEPG